jgi:hypothetical protein
MSDPPVFVNLKMKDRAESFRIKKEDMFDLPMRLLIIGKSQLAGKTNLLGNLLVRGRDQNDLTGAQCYANDFDPDNIYIVCPSTNIDEKWETIIKEREIPASNVYNDYDEEALLALYDKLVQQFHESIAKEEKPKHKLIIFDDVSYSGHLKDKKNGVFAKIFQNGRQPLISTIVLAQKYSDILTAARENCTGLCVFECTQKQAELVYADHGKCEKPKFIKALMKYASKTGEYLVINYSNPVEKRFQDSRFAPIKGLTYD